MIRIFSILLLLIVACKNQPEDLIQTQDVSPKLEGVSAHRGGKNIANYPENCLETIQRLYAEGIRIFEVDINQTNDGVLVLMHDRSIDRTTDGTGRLNKLNYKNLKDVRLKDHAGRVTEFKVPTLVDVLNWGHDKGVYFMLDFKSQSVLSDVIKEVKATGSQDNVVLISYSKGAAIRMHKRAPNLKLSVAMRNSREFESMMDSGIPTENMIAFTGTRLSSPDLYKAIKANGIPVILGTLGNLDRRAESKDEKPYLEWQKMGVDIFATDRPLAVKSVLNAD